MKNLSPLFVIIVLFVSLESFGQSFHPNRSYQANINYSLINQDDEVRNAFLFEFSQGFHNVKGLSFLYDLTMQRATYTTEMKFSSLFRKSYLRKEKIEAYIGIGPGVQVYRLDRSFIKELRPRDWTLFLTANLGYQFFLNKNTALAWDLNYRWLYAQPQTKKDWYKNLEVFIGDLNTTLKIRYYLQPQRKESVSPNSYRLHQNRWMIGGTLELGALNALDEEGIPLLNILNPVFGIMVSEKWMIGSGIHVSTSSNPIDLIYFGASPFLRIYMTETYARLSIYSELWTLIMDKAENPKTTKDYELFHIGLGTSFGIGYWLNPNVILNFSLGVKLLKDARESPLSVKSSYNKGYFKFGMETFL